MARRRGGKIFHPGGVNGERKQKYELRENDDGDTLYTYRLLFLVPRYARVE